MKYLFSILLIIFYVSNSNAKDLTNDCDEIAKSNNIEWSVEEDGEWFLDEKVYVKNKTNFKEITFKKSQSESALQEILNEAIKE